MERILKICKDEGYEFLGFAEGEYKIQITTHLKLKCLICGCEWDTTSYNNFLCRRKCCPKCNAEILKKKQTMSEEEALSIVNETLKLNENLEFLGWKEGKWDGSNKTHLIIKCKKCGCVMDGYKIHKFKEKHWCAACKKAEMYQKKSNDYKLNINVVLRNIQKKCDEYGCEFLGFVGGEYVGNKNTYIITRCKTCGFVKTTQTYNNFMSKGFSCQRCNHIQKEKEILSEVKYLCSQKGYKFIEFVGGEFKTEKTKMVLKCNKCDNVWNTLTIDKLRLGRGCPKCAKNKLIKANTIPVEEKIKRIEDECSKRGFEFLGFVDKNETRKDAKIILKCKKCGNIWNTTSYCKFIGKETKGCPKCNKSNLENDVIELLETNEIPYEYNNRKILNGLELDFYIPSKNIAIECQGIQHFQPTRFGSMTLEKAEKIFKRQQEKDKQKIEMCKNLNIQLIHFSNIKDVKCDYELITEQGDLKKILSIS